MSCINKMIDKIMDREWEPVDYRPMNPIIKNILDANKSGLYVAHFVGNENTIVAKAIKKISGDYSHSILIWHEPFGIISHLSDMELYRLIKKYDTYYRGNKSLENIAITHSLVLGRADSNGMNYFNFSHYSNRKMILHKIEGIDYRPIINYMLTEDVMKKNYDYTGLAFWWLFRMFDDEWAWYCSEQVKDVLCKFGFDPCPGEDNPSPTQLAEYALKNFKILYDSRGK